MPESEFVNLLIIVAIAFAVPGLLGLAPRVRLPAVVLEIVAGIIVGPSVLGWVEVDEPVAVFAAVGLAFLLFLARLEIGPHNVRGTILRLAAAGSFRRLRSRVLRVCCSRRRGWSSDRSSSRSS